MEPAKHRIFISHSAKETPAQELRDDLAEALRQAGHAVLLDKDELQLGKNWRSTLNQWIRGCDAAVVLISESALTSRFVAYEVGGLTFRNDDDDRFLLIPVFVDPVTNQMVQESLLEPTRIHDVQTLIKEVPKAQVIQQVLAKMNDHKERCTLDRHTQYLLELLPGVPPDKPERRGRLEAAIEELDDDLGAWMPITELKEALAMSMMGAGLKRATKIIKDLADLLPQPKEQTIAAMADLIGTSWIDDLSLSEIPKAAKGPQHISINGAKPLTATMYMIRASPYAPTNPFQWRVRCVDALFGEDAEKDLHRLVQKSLMDLLEVDDEADLKEELEDWVADDDANPIFMALPFPSDEFDGDLLKTLQEDFPGVTFFLLMGSDRPGAKILKALKKAHVVYLQPDLGKDQEDHYCKLYNRKARILRGFAPGT